MTLIAPLLRETPSLWKWMIIAAQSALQGAMVCALVDSTGTSVLNKDSAAKMLDWLQAGGEDRGDPPKERLDYFDNLLEKSIRELGLNLNPKQRSDIDRLHGYFRNNFMHFTPKGYCVNFSVHSNYIGAINGRPCSKSASMMCTHNSSKVLTPRKPEKTGEVNNWTVR